MEIIEIVKQYLQIGFTHVIPLGFDHILFILSIFFLNSNLKSVIIQCSVFTLAHSITLGLTAAGYILPNPKIIEPIIAISILVASIENLFHHKINSWRLIIIFIFGLIHGMGFANALKDVGLPPEHFLASLLSFNVGVELAQITVIVAVYFLIAKWFSKKDYYYSKIVYPLSSLIACVALYWTVERILG
ncbi:MAG: hypothetical protein RJA07_226 [Bacteroidota bacterium]|jgi:hypothetical protein